MVGYWERQYRRTSTFLGLWSSLESDDPPVIETHNSLGKPTHKLQTPREDSKQLLTFGAHVTNEEG